MNLTEIPQQISEQLQSVTEIAQANLVGTIEWVTEHGVGMLPRPAAKLRNRLPQATHLVDLGFDAVDSFLRSQRDLATRVANAMTPASASAQA